MSAPSQTSQLHDPSQPPPAPGWSAARANDETVQEVQRDTPPGATTSSPTNGPAPQRSQVQGAPGARGNAFTTDRPLGVKPTPEGGVAIGGQSNLPEGRANVADKIVGKAQKVIGKYTHDPDLHEKGELRETGGKSAVEGRARAAHD